LGFAVCRQFGLVDLCSEARTGLLRTDSIVCKAPVWKRFGAGLTGSVVPMGGQHPASCMLL